MLKIKPLLLKSQLHNIALKHSETKLVQKYGEVFAFVFKTCWFRELMKKGSSTEATKKKTTHKLTNWMEIILLQLCLQQLLPRICWATQKPVKHYITKYLCIRQISQQRHVQVRAKGSKQLFLISHQINECFYLSAVLNKPSCYNSCMKLQSGPPTTDSSSLLFNWFSVFIFKNINIHILRTHLGISLEFFSPHLVPGRMEHQVHNAEVQTLTYHFTNTSKAWMPVSLLRIQ